MGSRRDGKGAEKRVKAQEEGGSKRGEGGEREYS